jgi:putative transposase
MAILLMNVLFHYQSQSKYRLHEFVVMPNHFHALLTPLPPVTLERVLQFIKGGFSFRAKKELGFVGEIWQTSFYDHRVRDGGEYSRFRHYIHMNPVRRGLVPSPDEFPYSSAVLKLDEVPQWLKPAA